MLGTRYGAGMLVKADGEGGEDRGHVARRLAPDRFVDMLQATLHRYPVARKQRELRGVAGKPFERDQAVDRGDLADRVHSGMEIERGQTRSGFADLSQPKTDLVPDL